MARQRRACVQRLRDARKTWPGAMRDWMPRLLQQLTASFPDLKMSRSQLYDWDQKYARPCDLVKLIDTRGGNTRGQSDPAAWKAFKDLYLHENQPSIRFCWERVKELAKENGWAWMSVERCYAQLNDRIPPEVQTRHRQPAIWRGQLRPTIGQNPEAWKANQCWVGDHKQLDLWCTWRNTIIRPWLTTWMDWRTRRVCGRVLSENPNSTTILAALRHGLLHERNMGGPEAVWIDNGKDYDAWVFHGQTKKERQSRIEPALNEGTAAGIFTALKIDAHFSVPFNPNGKSRLERWFRTLESFSKTFDSYAGFSVATRPERLNDVLKVPRLIPSFELVNTRIAQHIDGYNAQPDHDRDDMKDGGERLSPDAALARWTPTKRVMADPEALNLLLQQWHKPVTAGRNGIVLALCGRAVAYGQFSPELTPYKALSKADRKPLLVSYDQHDIRTVRVHDGNWRFICTAKMNQLGGLHGTDPISLKHVADLNREKALYERSLKHVNSRTIVGLMTTEEQLADMAARDAAPPQTAAPMQIVRTPLDGQSEKVERAERRQAVGAESLLDGLPSLESLRRQQRARRGPDDINILEHFESMESVEFTPNGRRQPDDGGINLLDLMTMDDDPCGPTEDSQAEFLMAAGREFGRDFRSHFDAEPEIDLMAQLQSRQTENPHEDQ
jgi:transposase InsO family protein